MDPMEKLIANALDKAGFGYVTDFGGSNPSGLDFRLENGIEIEVKRFHSGRIGEQMSRAPNVIAAQGEDAVLFLALLIRAAAAQGIVTEGGDSTKIEAPVSEAN